MERHSYICMKWTCTIKEKNKNMNQVTVYKNCGVEEHKEWTYEIR